MLVFLVVMLVTTLAGVGIQHLVPNLRRGYTTALGCFFYICVPLLIRWTWQGSPPGDRWLKQAFAAWNRGWVNQAFVGLGKAEQSFADCIVWQYLKYRVTVGEVARVLTTVVLFVVLPILAGRRRGEGQEKG
jgi:hypothetical protein